MSATSHRDLAARLLDAERRALNEGSAPGPAAEIVCQKFYRGLSPLVTAPGCQAFLHRSLNLARHEFPFLDGVRAGPTADLCLVGIDASLEGIEADRASDAVVAVIANMVGLLDTFIGEDLARHVIHGVWWETGHPGGEREEEA